MSECCPKYCYDWEYWIGADRKLLYVSPSCERITGYRPDEFIADPDLMLSIVHLDDRENVEKEFNHMMDPSIDVCSMDFRIITRKGSQRWINHYCQAVFGYDGSWLGRRASNRDITDRKVAEQQVLQADKMASLGLLSAGVAHEIINPLNLILLNMELLQNIWKDFLPIMEHHAESEPHKRYGGLKIDYLKEKLNILLSDTYLSAKRIEAVVGNLKSFARKTDSYHKEPVQINKAIQNAFKLTQSTLKKFGIEIDLDLNDKLPEIEGNIQNIEQIFVNLIINGIQAHDRDCKGKIGIRTEFKEYNKQIVIHVSDTGRGIDPEISDKIFNPFVTTRQAEGGTGLGLAIVYNLVKSLNGDIQFQSEKGKGTTFTVFFPLNN